MRLSTIVCVCILVSLICPSRPACQCRKCPPNDPGCKSMGGCFSIDIDLDGDLIGKIRECHVKSSNDRFLRDLLTRLPPDFRPEVITTVRSIPLSTSESGSSLIFAVTYCRPIPQCNNASKFFDGVRRQDGQNGSCDDPSTDRDKRFVWKAGGELIGSDLCNEPNVESSCKSELHKSTFSVSGKPLTFCEWYHNRSDVMKEKMAGNHTAATPEDLRTRSNDKIWYGALGAVLFSLCLGSGIGIYEFIRWRRIRRRRKAGVGFGDQVVSGKTSKSLMSKSGSSGSVRSKEASTLSKDSFRKSEVGISSMGVI